MFQFHFVVWTVLVTTNHKYEGIRRSLNTTFFTTLSDLYWRSFRHSWHFYKSNMSAQLYLVLSTYFSRVGLLPSRWSQSKSLRITKHERYNTKKLMGLNLVTYTKILQW